MTENTGIQEVKKREFFVKKFVPKLEEWKKDNKDKGGTQKAFAKMIGVSEDMIKAYKSGETYPRDKTLKEIRRVLGVPDDYFTPTTEKELYEYSQDFMTDIGENKILPYCEEIGLDPQFLVVVSKLIGESLGDQFPFWTPIILNPNYFSDLENRYIRPDPLRYWSDSAEMKPDIKMFQIEAKKNGSDKKKLLTLTDPDLLFLRDVQNEVRDYVEFLFLKRKKELKKEGEEASRKAWIPVPNGGYALKTLTADERNSIDRYFKNYPDQKAKKEERREEDGDDQNA